MDRHPSFFEHTAFLWAPPERVWRALSEVDELNRWETVFAQVDLRPGGAFWFDYDYGASDEGTFVAVEPPRLLVQHWTSQVTESIKEDLRSVTTLTPLDGGTALHVRVSGYGEDEDQQWLYESMVAGWEKDLVDLKIFIESGRDGRPMIWPGLELGARYITLRERRVPEVGVDAGAYVLEVLRGKPAEGAGLVPGDTIVALDGIPVRSFRDLTRAIGLHRAGDAVPVEFFRDRRRQVAHAVIGSSKRRAMPALA